MYHVIAPRKILLFSILILSILSFSPALSQDQTNGLILYDSSSFFGYTLFTPIASNSTFLIDNYGRLIHSWESEYTPGLSCYLLENGNLLRTIHIIGTAGAGGGFQTLDWDGNILWQYEYYGTDHLQHHDIEYLPGGNVLILAWEKKTFEEAVAAGRDPSLLANDTLLPEHIVEVRQTGPTTGDIVWEWHLWDHLIQDFDSTKNNFGVVEDHPELVDLNYILGPRADWNHANSVQYNEDLDQIIISSRSFDEFWIIDHSTTTIEAAGHTGGKNGMGGDILYRWGNPETYRAGDSTDQRLFKQHDAHWIDPGLPGEGNILVFNNGTGRLDGNYSSIDEIVPPVDVDGNYAPILPGEAHGPENASWIYAADPVSGFFARRISGAQRQPNGNTLICSGVKGRLFEVTNNGDIVWEYKNPVTINGTASQGDTIPPETNDVFRCYRYAPDYPGLVGKTLIPGSPVEIYPLSIAATSVTPENPERTESISFTTIVKCDIPINSVELHIDTGNGYFSSPLSATPGDSVFSITLPPLPASDNIPFYISAINDTGGVSVDPVIAPTTTYNFTVHFLCGDPNNGGSVNILDATYLINYLYKDGPAPDPDPSADVNNSEDINILDVTYLINYIYRDGPEPVCP